MATRNAADSVISWRETNGLLLAIQKNVGALITRRKNRENTILNIGK